MLQELIQNILTMHNNAKHVDVLQA
ncbi:hypothetical protein DSL72_000580 [Monilinia vaccinii-corymbosi]|uniref:Uncharacterized protein n=1 Tax=Monilinia vaccinii-corymbosi TaxID=61207 RepID=A0A8A3P9M9_9HELO|nr:hypothetical protein DSL72_000580 [Monilinia vaccinii-corymbosi]